MSKPDDISHEVWNAAEAAFDLMLCNCIEASGTTEQLRIDSIEPLARAILAERERITAMLAPDAPHSPRRYIYDTTPDRRIIACDRLEAAIRAGEQ